MIFGVCVDNIVLKAYIFKRDFRDKQHLFNHFVTKDLGKLGNFFDVYLVMAVK